MCGVVMSLDRIYVRRYQKSQPVHGIASGVS